MPKGGLKYGSGKQTKSSHGSTASPRKAPGAQGGKKGSGTRQMGNPHQKHSGPK